MQNKIQQRLQELRTEFESGQKMLADLEAQQATLKTTLLRISGAIQVLEEILATEAEAIADNSHVSESQLITSQQE